MKKLVKILVIVTTMFSGCGRLKRSSDFRSPLSTRAFGTDSSSEKVGGHSELVSVFHRKFPDLLDLNGETVPPNLSPPVAGHYVLDHLVVHDDSHVLMGTRDLDFFKVIFKYQTNCFAVLWNQMCAEDEPPPVCRYAEQDPDALFREYEITKTVFDQLRIAPKAYLISEPVLITVENAKNLKTDFKIFESENTSPEKCEAVQSTVRVIVEQLVGPTVSQLFKKQIGSKERLDLNEMRLAAKVFHKSLIMLEQLHGIGIVHGDFHYGNLAFRKNFDLSLSVTREDDLDLVLIDFGLATFWRNQPPSDPSFYRFYFQYPAWISPYQLEGHRVGRRDDLFRSFESFMDVLVSGSIGRLFLLADRLDRGIESRPRLRILKKNMDFCALLQSENSLGFPELGTELSVAVSRYPGLVSVHAKVGSYFGEIQKKLREIQTYVRNLGDPSEEPNYAMLIHNAREIVNLLYQ